MAKLIALAGVAIILSGNVMIGIAVLGVSAIASSEG